MELRRAMLGRPNAPSEFTTAIRECDDINWQDDDGTTALHAACHYHMPDVVALLLRHPDIDVNVQDHKGHTAVMICARKPAGRRGCLQMLLADPRVDATFRRRTGETALFVAALYRHCCVIRWLIASGKDFYLSARVEYRSEQMTASQMMRSRERYDSALLIEGFEHDPFTSRWRIWAELGVTQKSVGHVFAIIIFVCDDFLLIVDSASRWGRFLTMAQNLPMELVKILCHRACGSTKTNIASRDSELSFRDLASMFK